MKTDIHPSYATDDGAVFLREHLHDEKIHQGGASPRALQRVPPLLHGHPKLVDTGGRVERFERRYGPRDQKAQLTWHLPGAVSILEMPADQPHNLVQSSCG